MMETLKVHRTNSIDWKPSAVVALATSKDESQVAAARGDGSLEIWLVSPGSVGWHCQLTIHGDPNSTVSSLVWCPSGRLLSSSIDGSISEWDLFHLKQKIVLDSIGVSIWQMALEPLDNSKNLAQSDSRHLVNGYANNKTSAHDDDGPSGSDDDSDSVEFHEQPVPENLRLAIGCDDGCVRFYVVPDSDGLTLNGSLPRVSGRVLSIAWSLDAKLIFSGSSDGFIRCWNAKHHNEVYRITAGHGGLNCGPEICIWSLLFLRSGTVVSADSSGSVQFWDSEHGTLLQAHSFHKGDVNALAAAPSHNRVFSAGSDGQVVLYKVSADTVGSGESKSSAEVVNKWVYIGYVRAHTHDIKALTVAVPISREDPTPDEKVRRVRCQDKPVESSYSKWAHLRVPMLISAGDDTKLFAYSVQEFTKFAPHDICPAPQKVPIQLVLNTKFNGAPLMLVQSSSLLDILHVRLKSGALPEESSGRKTTTQLIARVKSKASKKILCSAISCNGVFFAYSDHVKPLLFELRTSNADAAVNKRILPRKLPYAHSMVFSADSSRLMIAGHDRKIYVVDVARGELLHSFTPCRKVDDDNLPPTEPPITKMFTSSDGQWLAAINCFGDIYVFNLELQRQHWFMSRLDGASVTAGGFPPSNSNVLIIITSTNQVYAFDVEARELGEWSRRNLLVLPRRFQEFPGEVIGLSFPPSSCSTSVIIYSARAMCVIDFGMPIDEEDGNDLTNALDLYLKKLENTVKSTGLKRKRKDSTRHMKKNFEFSVFRDPVLFVGHLSENSVLLVEKAWREVVQQFEAPVDRHIFGT